MPVENEKIIKFSEKMEKDLSKDVNKKDWNKSKDPWWYLSQLAKNVNELEGSMKARKNINKLTVSIANYSLIISQLYKKK